MPLTRPEVIETVTKLIGFGLVGGIFSFARLLVTQDPRTKSDFVIGTFVGTCVASLVGYTLEDMGYTDLIWTYVAISAILSDKLILLIIKIGAEVSDDPQPVMAVLKRLIDKK